jgi:hypothetical protein
LTFREPILTRVLGPLRAERLWVTLIWTLTLAVGLAAWDWAERGLETDAARQTLVLLPKSALDEASRKAIQTKLGTEPGVMAAEWISPAELTSRIARRFPQSEWRDLFPADEGWLAWVLEVRPSAPLDSLPRLRDFVARRQQEESWRLVLWDPEALAGLVRQRETLRAVAGFFLALVALGGVAALLRMPLARGRRLGLVLWSAVLGALGPGAVWAVAMLSGGEPDEQCLAIGMGSGLLLASVIAPMLRVREDKKKLSITVGEDAHERVR